MDTDLQMELETLPGGGVVLRLGGALNGGGAYALRERIQATSDRSARVVVDFSRLQKLSDFGLGILAMGIADMHRHGVELVGLGHHAQRILKAFGVERAA